MPAYATNMRLKFPIVALAVEIITIILFAVFVVYDDGKHHGHDTHSNETHHEVGPMELYPICTTGPEGIPFLLVHPILQEITERYLTSGRGASHCGCFPALPPPHPQSTVH